MQKSLYAGKPERSLGRCDAVVLDFYREKCGLKFAVSNKSALVCVQL